MPEKRPVLQLIWGILLAAAGIGVFFRVPQVMPQIEKMEAFSDAGGYIRFCFYFIGVLLIGGGAKKIHSHLKAPVPPAPAPKGAADAKRGQPLQQDPK